MKKLCLEYAIVMNGRARQPIGNLAAAMQNARGPWLSWLKIYVRWFTTAAMTPVPVSAVDEVKWLKVIDYIVTFARNHHCFLFVVPVTISMCQYRHY